MERPQDRNEGYPVQRQEFFEGRRVTPLNIRPGMIRLRAPSQTFRLFRARAAQQGEHRVSLGLRLSTSPQAHAAPSILSFQCRTRARPRTPLRSFSNSRFPPAASVRRAARERSGARRSRQDDDTRNYCFFSGIAGVAGGEPPVDLGPGVTPALFSKRCFL